MDRKYIEENEIEIKYLRNQLTPEQLEEFEVYLMENPEAIEGLELIETLGSIETVRGTEKKRRLMKPSFYFELMLSHRAAVSSIAILTVAMSFVISQYRNSYDDPIYIGIERNLTTQKTRFLDIDISNPAQFSIFDKHLSFEIEVKDLEPQLYEITLTSEKKPTTKVRIERISIYDEELGAYIQFHLNTSKLDSGIYSVSVKSMGPNIDQSNFKLRLIK